MNKYELLRLLGATKERRKHQKILHQRLRKRKEVKK